MPENRGSVGDGPIPTAVGTRGIRIPGSPHVAAPLRAQERDYVVQETVAFEAQSACTPTDNEACAQHVWLDGVDAATVIRDEQIAGVSPDVILL
jgi:hypothetical protein